MVKIIINLKHAVLNSTITVCIFYAAVFPLFDWKFIAYNCLKGGEDGGIRV